MPTESLARRAPDLDALIHFYETLTPQSLPRFAEFYADEARFKDPFNDVTGLPALIHIFQHMFRQVKEPAFVITERIVAPDQAMLGWRFSFRARPCSPRLEIEGVSHLRFDAQGKVVLHRDYWDAAEELYAKLPLLGLLMRGLQRSLSAGKVA